MFEHSRFVHFRVVVTAVEAFDEDDATRRAASRPPPIQRSFHLQQPYLCDQGEVVTGPEQIGDAHPQSGADPAAAARRQAGSFLAAAPLPPLWPRLLRYPPRRR